MTSQSFRQLMYAAGADRAMITVGVHLRWGFWTTVNFNQMDALLGSAFALMISDYLP